MTSAYFDASVALPLFVEDLHSDRAKRALAQVREAVLSDWTLAEMASAAANRVRIGLLTREDAHAAMLTWDEWLEAKARRVDVQSRDIRAAETILRSLDSPLRPPDALHVAISRRSGLPLVTFDLKMADAARRLGVQVLQA